MPSKQYLELSGGQNTLVSSVAEEREAVMCMHPFGCDQSLYGQTRMNGFGLVLDPLKRYVPAVP